MALDDPLIEQAVEYHQGGDFNEAAKICRALLKDNPQDVKALHLLGVIFSDVGLNKQAIGFLEQALALGGPNSSVLHNYGVALQRQGELRQAARAFRHAADASPLRTDSWYSLGEVELVQNQPEAAVKAFEKVLEQDPTSVEARNNLGVALRKIGRLEDARTQLQIIVGTDPKNPAAQNNLGITETKLNHLADAKLSFQTAIEVAPHYGDAHYNLGNVYLAEMDYQAAEKYYLRALELDAENNPAIYHLALCRQKQRAFDEALTLLNPLIAKLGNNIPENIQVLCGRANVLRDLGQFEAALADIEAALALAPDDLAVMGNKALTLQHAGRLTEAISTYREAFKANPESEQLQTNFAQALLLGGQFKEGWLEFEGRLQTSDNIARRTDLPREEWRGESLKGKHLLLWCEQGLGDTLQFIRYLPKLEALAGEVTLICPDRLTRLLQSFRTKATIVGQGGIVPNADLKAPLMSLPYLLGLVSGLDTILNNGPYLTAEPELIDYWGEKLGPRAKPRIGIAWQGNPNYEADHQRSIPLSAFDPLLAQQDYQFISLQQGFGQEQLVCRNREIVELGEAVDKTATFIDTAAIMANLDLVITSDTAIPHLAGALGVPVWLMLPKTPDWRWLLNRSDSPWYSTMRLFRQTAAHNWQSVIDQVVEALDQEASF